MTKGKGMPKCPHCGSEILDARRSEPLDLEALTPARADDQLELLITAELPGVAEEDVEVRVSGGNTLTIRGQTRVEHEEKDGKGHTNERCVGSFSRSIRLPFEVKEEKIHAALDDGVLTVRVQKLPELRKVERAIEVKRTDKGQRRDPATA